MPFTRSAKKLDGMGRRSSTMCLMMAPCAHQRTPQCTANAHKIERAQLAKHCVQSQAAPRLAAKDHQANLSGAQTWLHLRRTEGFNALRKHNWTGVGVPHALQEVVNAVLHVLQDDGVIQLHGQEERGRERPGSARLCIHPHQAHGLLPAHLGLQSNQQRPHALHRSWHRA